MTEVRKKIHEARAGVLAERKAREDAAEHQELMAWNEAENRRLHELRCVGMPGGPGAVGTPG